MGRVDVKSGVRAEVLQGFLQALLRDVRALEIMLRDADLFDPDRRIGAEQEMFLVDPQGRPVPCALDILEKARDARLTTELALFNLEANLTPRLLRDGCLSEMEEELAELLGIVARQGESHRARPYLTGILPTLRSTDLCATYRTPKERYAVLDEAIMRLAGGATRCYIKGLDELDVVRDDVMFESANTSFQVHLQVTPAEFARLYNITQLVCAPVLAGAVNSPVLLGNRLWQETRIAVFQHSAEGRSAAQMARGHPPRVDFGFRWVEDSVLEIFQEDIARFRILVAQDVEENAIQCLAEGRVPELHALRIHNGTVYRWNRPCYGVRDGRAHLRIECRPFPAGPTLRDEMANAAFLIGLILHFEAQGLSPARHLPFEQARENFFSAARHGLQAQMGWIDGRTHPVTELVKHELLERARDGLTTAAVQAADIDLYLGGVGERFEADVTGASWVLDSLVGMGVSRPTEAACRAIVCGTARRQLENVPVHLWDPVSLSEAPEWHVCYRTVGQFMTRDLFTVRMEDPVDLAANVMDWRHIRHVPVEDDQGNLVGLVSQRQVFRRLLKCQQEGRLEPVNVGAVMVRDPIAISPETPTLEAIALMDSHGIGCLPVVEAGRRLVGILTASDFLPISRMVLERKLLE